MGHSHVRLVPLFLAASCIACGSPRSQPPDLVLVGGKVFTADENNPWAEAIAIRGDHILAVGSNDDIEDLVGLDSQRIDLLGRVVVPGINDAHRHFQTLPEEVHRLELTPLAPSWEETRGAIRRAVEELPAGTPIHGVVGVAVMTNPSINRDLLDELAPDHPLTLAAFYGHGEIWNTPAMKEYGIGDDEPDPMGGFFERRPGSQMLNGRVWEYAHWRPRHAMSAGAGDAQIVAEMQALNAVMLELGITSFQILPMMPFERYVRLIGEADPPLRVRAIRFPMTSAAGRSVDEGRGILAPAGLEDRVTVSGVKWIVDGTPLERASPLREPYSDAPGESGRLNFPPTEIAAMLRESIDTEERLLLHVVGDRAVEVVFDAMETMRDVDWPAQRVRIEHGDGVTGDLIERAARLGVIVVQNPTHFGLAELEQRFGPDRLFSRFRSLMDAGVLVAIGSDGPPNPWLDVMLAAIHPRHASEAISVEEAVTAYTLGAAFAEDREEVKGSIAVGKLADLAVLSQDVFTIPVSQIVATRSVLTIVGGEIVHDSGELE